MRIQRAVVLQGLRRIAVDRHPKRPFAARGMAELRGQMRQQLGFLGRSAELAQRLRDDLGMAKALEDCHQVGESFMETHHIGVGGFHEMFAQTVQQGVGGFMDDDVVRQAREHIAAGKRPVVHGRIGRPEVAEAQFAA
ncbi:hypothetical protein D3C72_1472680 [compost metagenome]